MFGIPEVVLHTLPSQRTGTALASGQQQVTSNFEVRFTQDGLALYSSGRGPVKGIPISVPASWRAPAVISNSTTTTSVLQLENGGILLIFLILYLLVFSRFLF